VYKLILVLFIAGCNHLPVQLETGDIAPTPIGCKQDVDC
jgi:hypothetical protein